MSSKAKRREVTEVTLVAKTRMSDDREYLQEKCPAIYARPGMMAYIPDENMVEIIAVLDAYMVYRTTDGRFGTEEWETVSLSNVKPDSTATGSSLILRPLARPGMQCRIAPGDTCIAEDATIVSMTEDHCIVATSIGDVVLSWDEVDLCNARPDPAFTLQLPAGN